MKAWKLAIWPLLSCPYNEHTLCGPSVFRGFWQNSRNKFCFKDCTDLSMFEKNILVIWNILQILGLQSQLSLEHFFSHSRSEQFWKQNTNHFKRWKLYFAFYYTWYLLTLQILEVSRNSSKYGLKIAHHKTLEPQHT